MVEQAPSRMFELCISWSAASLSAALCGSEHELSGGKGVVLRPGIGDVEPGSFGPDEDVSACADPWVAF